METTKKSLVDKINDRRIDELNERKTIARSLYSMLTNEYNENLNKTFLFKNHYFAEKLVGGFADTILRVQQEYYDNKADLDLSTSEEN